MTNRRRSFAQRLSIIVIVLNSILFIGVLAIVAQTCRHLIAEEATKSATNLLDATIADVEKELHSVEVATANTAWLVEGHENDEEYLRNITRKLVESNAHIVGSAVAFIADYHPGRHYYSPYSWIDAETQEIKYRHLGSETYDYFLMDWFQIPFLTRKPCWTEPYYDDEGGEQWICTYSRPIFDKNGKLYAIVTADISLEWLSRKFDAVHPYKDSFTILVSRNGSYVSAPNRSWLRGATIFSVAAEKEDESAWNTATDMILGEKGSCEFTNDGKSYFSVYGPLSNGWSASIICPYRSVLARTLEMNLVVIIMAVAGLFVLFLLCRASIGRVASPLRAFSESAMNIAKGDFNTRLPEIKTNDEIMQLRDSFEYMQESLTQYIQDLKTTTAGKQRLQSELNIAHDIQMQMLAKNFEDIKLADVFADIHPAKEVGGDLYDVIARGDTLYFAVGDVSGKGVSAALFMAITRSALRFVGGVGISLSDMAYKINRNITASNESGMFVTLLLARIDMKTRMMDYCNAGHNPPVIIPRNGAPYFLPLISNLVVGIVDDFQYEPQSRQMQEGDTIVLYTDGVTEAEAPNKDQYGEKRLMEWARTITPEMSAQEATDSLMADIRHFTRGNEQNDDITIVVIRT